MRTHFAIVEAALLKAGAVKEVSIVVVLVAVAGVRDPVAAVNLADAGESH